jgi:hypothetical protein
MVISSQHLEAARDAALDCAILFAAPLRKYATITSQTDFSEITVSAAEHAQAICEAIHRFDRHVSKDVIDALVVANSPRSVHPELAGHCFLTYHEAACAAAEIAYVKLCVISEELPACCDDSDLLDESIHFLCQDLHNDWREFKLDVFSVSIRVESAAAQRLLGQPTTEQQVTLAKKDDMTEERDKFIYDECMKGTAYSQIIYLLRTKFLHKCLLIMSPSGIRYTARQYAIRHGLPEPPPRRKPRRRSQARRRKPR